jgi:hypothetical protein
MHIARLFAGWLVLLTTSSIAWAGTDASETAMDWQCWLDLPVQNGGRQKPLDTLARETLRQTSNRAYVVDSETGHHLTPTELYLTLLFEWTGWDHERNDSLLLSTDWASQYTWRPPS